MWYVRDDGKAHQIDTEGKERRSWTFPTLSHPWGIHFAEHNLYITSYPGKGVVVTDPNEYLLETFSFPTENLHVSDAFDDVHHFWHFDQPKERFVRVAMWQQPLLETGDGQLSLPRSGLQSPLFRRDTRNPVFVGTATWQEDSIQEPTVLYEDGIWKMWYHGGWQLGAVGYATSEDRVTWTKYAGNPVVGIGRGSEGNETNLLCPFLLRHDGLYYLYYKCLSDTTDEIWEAKSSDGINFSGNRRVLQLGVASAWDGFYFRNMAVWVEGNKWFMIYEAMQKGGGRWVLGLATSSHGKNWVKHTDWARLVGRKSGNKTGYTLWRVILLTKDLRIAFCPQ